MAATLEQIIEMYARADERLRALVSSLEEGSIGRQRKEILLQQIEEILAELTGQAGQQTALLIGDSYRAGATEAVQSITSAGVAHEMVNDTLKPLIHQQAAQAIMDDLFYSILEATDHMGADAKQRIEEAVRAANERSLLTGTSRRESTRQAIAELNSRGITGIIAKNGAQIPADKYMAGVIHYHQRKAHVTGTENMATQNGYDLVYVNYVGITCEHCARKQGRVYSLSGNDKRWPQMTDEYRPPYHSHCVHSMSIWIEEYQSPEEVKRLMDISSRLGEETRSEQHIKRYKELQQQKARANETRKQWMRYKATIPDAPDLKTFAIMKARNTQSYRDLQQDFRKIVKSDVNQNKVAVVLDTHSAVAESLKKKFGISLVNYENRDLDVLKEIHNATAEVLSRYPAMTKYFDRVEFSKLDRSLYALGGYTDVRVNSFNFRSMNYLNASYMKDVESGFHPAGTKGINIYTHELGHVLTNYIRLEAEAITGDQKFTSSLKLANTMRRETQKRVKFNKNEQAEGLSIYSTESNSEFVAEAFAEYIGSKNPRPIAKALGEVLEDMYTQVSVGRWTYK